MGVLQITRTGSAVARRLSALAELYDRGQASELMARTLDKLITYEADQTRAQLSQLQADLAEFEQRFGLASAEFYRRYQAGETDDRMDHVEWASLVQMAESLRERLRVLTGEGAD